MSSQELSEHQTLGNWDRQSQQVQKGPKLARQGHGAGEAGAWGWRGRSLVQTIVSLPLVSLPCSMLWGQQDKMCTPLSPPEQIPSYYKGGGEGPARALLVETVLPVTSQSRCRLAFFISETSWGNWRVIKSSARGLLFIYSIVITLFFFTSVGQRSFFYQYKQDLDFFFF